MATAKQLAALKKARAARKKNLAKKKRPAKRRKVTTKKRTVAKRKTTRKTIKKNYLYVSKTAKGKKYWYTGAGFDDSKSKAKPVGQAVAMKAAKKFASKLTGYSFYWTGSVKKPSGGRGRNPVPPSSRAKINQASDLYEEFTGHNASEVFEIDFDFPSVGLEVGQCDGILYTTVRDGKTEKYIHKFRKDSRPTLAASFDGKKIAIVGGRYRFTERGIEDR